MTWTSPERANYALARRLRSTRTELWLWRAICAALAVALLL